MATVSFDNTKFKRYKTKKPYIFKKKKKPLVLTFDEQDREDFLTGFRKRKQQRKKKAIEELEIQVKAEKKRIRIEAKDALKKLVVSHRDIPELGTANEDTDIIDMDTHEVQITELDPAKLARENNWIGTNQTIYKQDNPTDEKSGESSDEEIEGMELKEKRKKPKEEAESKLKTKKDVKKFVQKVVTKNVKKSKIFQKKKQVESVKNKKIKMREMQKMEKGSKKTKNKRDKSRRN